MAAKRGSSRRPALLPDGLRVALGRRLVELSGVALFAVAIVLAVALATYHPADPSLNRITNAAPQNLIGYPGAYVADLLLQGLGLGAGLGVLALGSWAWRLMSHRGLPFWWFHLTLLPISILVSTIALATAPVPRTWPLDIGLGGTVGDVFLHGELAPVLRLYGVPYPTLLPGIAAALLLIVLVPLTLGLSRREWRGIGASAAGAGAGIARDLGAVGSGLKPASTGPRLTAVTAPHLLRAVDPPSAAMPTGDRREPVFGLSRLFPKKPAEPVDTDDLPQAGPVLVPKVEKRTARPRAGKRAEAEAQPTLNFIQETDGFALPPLALLNPPREARGDAVNEDALEQNARLLKSTLEEFGVIGEIVKVRPGPVVTLYELEPAPGTKSARVIGLADDIARSMSALSARIAVIPGRNAIGIELPNARRETVYLRELLETAEYETNQSKLALALGKDIGGAPVIADLARMPHLLVAGTTGSGKSVAINTMILSLLYRMTPEECRLIMVDPKMLELSVYDGIPHLLAPVVTEPQKAVVALKWAVREMEERYRKMSELGVRNISSYNERVAEVHAKADKKSRTVQTGFDPATGQPIFEERPFDLQPFPYIVVVVDELADLMLVAGKDIEALIQRLAQMARAAGIHLIMATQRPSVDVITGTIKANFPTRISFQVTSKIDSRTILGEQGAEQLLGQGDMLHMPGAGRISRVHGPFVSDEEVERIVAHLKEQGSPDYQEGVTEEAPDLGKAGGLPGIEAGGEDDLYAQAVDLIRRERKASTSFVQRHLQIGYNRAARIIERMEAEGLVGAANHVGKREVLAPELGE